MWMCLYIAGVSLCSCFCWQRGRRRLCCMGRPALQRSALWKVHSLSPGKFCWLCFCERLHRRSCFCVVPKIELSWMALFSQDMVSITIWWIIKKKERKNVLHRVSEWKQWAYGTPQQGVVMGLPWDQAAKYRRCSGWTGAMWPCLGEWDLVQSKVESKNTNDRAGKNSKLNALMNPNN